MANLQRIAIVRRSGDGLVQIAAVTDIAANLTIGQCSVQAMCRRGMMCWQPATGQR